MVHGGASPAKQSHVVLIRELKSIGCEVFWFVAHFVLFGERDGGLEWQKLW